MCGEETFENRDWNRFSDKKDSFLDKYNLEYSHEQWFFEDEEGENIGFFADRPFSRGKIRADKDNLLDNYRKFEEEHYDDTILREALKNINKNKYKGKYNFILNNCQDFSEDLR